jgi:hypothetical protein
MLSIARIEAAIFFNRHLAKKKIIANSLKPKFNNASNAHAPNILKGYINTANVLQ